MFRIFASAYQHHNVLCAGPPAAYEGSAKFVDPNGGIDQHENSDRQTKWGVDGRYILEREKPLADLCSWQIGGPARYSVEVKDEETLLAVIRYNTGRIFIPLLCCPMFRVLTSVRTGSSTKAS